MLVHSRLFQKSHGCRISAMKEMKSMTLPYE